MHEFYISKFAGETLDCAILDTGCTKNVCRQLWLSNYLGTLTGIFSKVVEEESSSTFRFGDWSTLISNKSVTSPATMGN